VVLLAGPLRVWTHSVLHKGEFAIGMEGLYITQHAPFFVVFVLTLSNVTLLDKLALI
jgi:hypothetical protein